SPCQGVASGRGGPMGERLEGKGCIVTGAAQGSAAAYTGALAGEGADVAIIDLKRIDQAGPVKDDVEALGRRALVIEADVSNAEQMAAMGKQVVHAGGHGDCLVNNAGLMFDQLTASWDDFLAVNFMGIINASNAVVPYLWEQRHGAIVNILSTAAYPVRLRAMFAAGEDSPPPTIAPQGYGLTKWMVIHQTRQ